MKSKQEEMSKEKEMLELFQVEELEKRYEMGWIKETNISGSVSSDGTVTGTVTLTIGK